MTAEAIANLLHARSAGRGKWMARCPSHNDGSPSLSIQAGSDGRVLLHCFAGCALDSILAALKLSSHDLSPGARLTPAQARQAAQERARRDAEARRRRAAHGRQCDRLLKLERVADALFARAARLPNSDGDAIAALGHEALRRLRIAEVELEAVR